MYVQVSLSQDGSYQKDLWVEHPLTWLPFGLQEAFSVCVWLGRSPDFGNKKYAICAGFSLLPYLPCYSCLGVSVNREWISSCFTLGWWGRPSASCLSIPILYICFEIDWQFFNILINFFFFFVFALQYGNLLLTYLNLHDFFLVWVQSTDEPIKSNLNFHHNGLAFYHFLLTHSQIFCICLYYPPVLISYLLSMRVLNSNHSYFEFPVW